MYSTRLSLQVCAGEQLLHAFCFFSCPSGPRVLTAALASFLLQLLAVLATFIISRSWTHILYTIKVEREGHGGLYYYSGD